MSLCGWGVGWGSWVDYKVIFVSNQIIVEVEVTLWSRWGCDNMQDRNMIPTFCFYLLSRPAFVLGYLPFTEIFLLMVS